VPGLFLYNRLHVCVANLMVNATWNCNELDQPILLMSAQGAPIYLKPGVTFYQVVGETSESWREGIDWHFVWHNP
jgi:hypothetical protein